MEIPVVENVLKLNDEIAALNRRRLRAAGVFTVDLMGAPGCGKTALLEATIDRLAGRREIGVLAGDLTTTRDAERLARHCRRVVQINTGKGCHLDANQVRQALDRLDFAGLELLVIENVGNLICPVGFDLGQEVKVGMFSVSGGDDKAAKHPHIVLECEVLLLNQIDLLPHVPFDLQAFREDLRRLNPRAELIETAAVRPADPGLAHWCEWLLARSGRTRADGGAPPPARG